MLSFAITPADAAIAIPNNPNIAGSFVFGTELSGVTDVDGSIGVNVISGSSSSTGVDGSIGVNRISVFLSFTMII